MDPEPNAADARTDPAPPLDPGPLRRELLVPDRTNTLITKTGLVMLGGRTFKTMCPGAGAWTRIAPWLNAGGELELPTPYTDDRIRCDYSAGLFVGACLSSTDLACLKRAMRADLVQDEEIITAVRSALSLWWPALDVALPID